MTLFIGGGGVKIEPLSVTTFRDGSSHASHTFSTNLGTAYNNDLLIVGAGAILTIQTATIAVNVNGIAATQVITVGSAARRASLFQITGQSGTGTVEITTSAAATQFFLGLWKLSRLVSQTASYSNSGTGGGGANPVSTTLNVPARGAGIAFMIGDVVTSGTTWTGLTEDFEATDAINGRATGASAKFATAQTGLSVSAAATISGQPRLVAASWR